MWNTRIAAAFGVAVVGGVCTPMLVAGEPPARTSAEDRDVVVAPAEKVRPAVLVLRVWDPQERGAARRVEVIEPRGLRRLPYDLRRPADDGQGAGDPDVARWQRNDALDVLAPDNPDALDADGTPRLGTDYELVRRYVPDRPGSAVRYYIYNIDLNNPEVARNWLELKRAERRAGREARFEYEAHRDWDRRKQRLLSEHEQALQEGIVLMQAGEYRSAVIALTRAAELNQGDAASRVYLALARVALGHDAEAATVLRRALELQPKLVPMQLDLAQYYPHPEDLSDQIAALAERIAHRSHATAADYFLLGFLEFQRGDTDDAHAAFLHAARKMPGDERTRKYLALTKPAAP